MDSELLITYTSKTKEVIIPDGTKGIILAKGVKKITIDIDGKKQVVSLSKSGGGDE